MAKANKTDAAESAEPTVTPTDDQRKLAVTAVRAILGCGQLDAETRVSEMKGSKVIAIAELEAAKKRREAVALIYS
jgi:hypothetical protein